MICGMEMENLLYGLFVLASLGSSLRNIRADRQTGAEAQNIYKSLLRFVVSDNEELVKRAVSAIQGMRALMQDGDRLYEFDKIKVTFEPIF